MQEFPVFTLNEVNERLAEVIRLTDDTASRLDAIEECWGRLPFKKFDAVRGIACDDLIRAEWAHRVARLGAMPKGFFTVDFQSADPEVVFCWSYGEESITHEHKVWENFAHRRRIADSDPCRQHPPAGDA